MKSNNRINSIDLLDITSRLFNNCQEKEVIHASRFAVSLVEFKCLRIMLDSRKLTVNQLAQKMSLTSGRITRLIDGLVEKNFVARESGIKDRRLYFLTLTKRGEKIADDLVQDHIKIHQEILEKIEKKYHKSMINGLSLLNDAVESWLNTNKENN